MSHDVACQWMCLRLAEVISVVVVTSHKRLVDQCVRQDMDIQLTDCRRASMSRLLGDA